MNLLCRRIHLFHSVQQMRWRQWKLHIYNQSCWFIIPKTVLFHLKGNSEVKGFCISELFRLPDSITVILLCTHAQKEQANKMSLKMKNQSSRITVSGKETFTKVNRAFHVRKEFQRISQRQWIRRFLLQRVCVESVCLCTPSFSNNSSTKPSKIKARYK